jgi:polyhydroxyalkanoate synthase
VKSATFFTAMIDFREPGDLGVFVDEPTVNNLEKKMQERGGFLEGSEMATTFNLMRANDLIWSFVINNYLMGKDPFPFDLLFWNSDSTRMPAKMHTFYLRNMYIKNLLVAPGGIELGGVPIDLKNVKALACFVSTIEDHIAPWKSTYLGAKALPGKVKFILGGSGHIAGIVNPPAANKYHYWTNDDLSADADAWLAAAEKHEGSWWSAWSAWMNKFSGAEAAARTPGKGKLKAIEDAPGSYAKFRLDAIKK